MHGHGSFCITMSLPDYLLDPNAVLKDGMLDELLPSDMMNELTDAK